MITISLCIIVKNEEKILARCLDSIADLMDEIIVEDTGSADRTKEIAAQNISMILSGWTTLVQPEIMPSPKLPGSIFILRMQMRY